MKTRTLIFIGILLLTCSISRSSEAATGNETTKNGTVNVFASPDLYQLTLKWAGEYTRINPTYHINVIKADDGEMAGMLSKEQGLGFISNEGFASFDRKSTWNLVVGRDVIVPVMNAKNPLLEEINKTGISPKAFTRFLDNSENQTWGTLLGNNSKVPVHIYMVNDPSVKTSVTAFLKVNPGKVNALATASAAEVMAAITKDPNAIGFCKMTSVMDANTQSLAENIKLLPLDKNGNGKIDFMEDIYGNPEDFTRGVWIGKYPKALSGNIYSVATIKPNNETEVAFLQWVLSDGQQFLNTNGYSDLVYSERQTQLDKLTNPAIILATPENNTYATIRVILLVVIGLVVIGSMIGFVIRSLRYKKESANAVSSDPPSGIDENSVLIPKGLYFDKTHTWAFMEPDGSVKIGIDDFLQHITGPLSGIGMKPAGVKVKKGDPLLTIIQKGKHLTVYSPVSGTIRSNNNALNINAAVLNTDPYSDGWVYTIEPTNWTREIQFLSMSEKYKMWLRDEFSRLKDFFAVALNDHTPEYAHVALQDGGAITDGILAQLNPKVWEDFQTKFIDTAK
jgi:glycine cleavage system H lipoate-binding protein/ABC-type phosphate transport system substrate-binding protein